MSFRLRAGRARVAVVGEVVAEPDAPVDLDVDGGDALLLLPGLVNAHDHLHRNHYPRLGAPPYPDVYAWGDDIHARHADAIERARAFPRGDALLFGALKSLLGAATTVVHHDAWEAALGETFPVRVPRLRSLHTLRTDEAVASAGGPPGEGPLLLHLAEGVGPAAAAEVAVAGRLGLLDADLVAVHGVGVDEGGARALAEAGAALVWCPTSNRFLYGRGPSGRLLRSGVDVLLGTDALVSGEGTLLDELRAAAAVGALDASELREAVGGTAARRLGLPAPSLEPGSPADLVALRRPPPRAGAADVRLVVVRGRPRLADAAFRVLFEALGLPCERIEVGDEPRWVEAPLGDVARRVVAQCPEAGRILQDPNAARFR